MCIAHVFNMFTQPHSLVTLLLVIYKNKTPILIPPTPTQYFFTSARDLQTTFIPEPSRIYNALFWHLLAYAHTAQAD